MAALVSDSFLRTCQMATVTSRGSRMLRRARAAGDWLKQRRLTFLAATTFRIHEKFSDQLWKRAALNTIRSHVQTKLDDNISNTIRMLINNLRETRDKLSSKSAMLATKSKCNDVHTY